MAPRQYELVQLGATGFTGKFTTTHICETFPSNLTWAVAGRSPSKLEAIVGDLKKRFPDRKPPSIEVCQHDDAELSQLAAKTRVIITTVGPFARYGEPVVKACANNGTGYVDATGEVPWVKDMADKYHELAKQNGAIIVPQCALESSFSDLFTYALTSYVREKLDRETESVTSLVWEIKSAPSGGTLETIFSIFELFSVRQLLTAMAPYALSPIPRPSGTYPPRSGLGRFTGMMQVPKLGLAVNAGLVMGVTNAAIVWRTWGLFQQAAASHSTPARKTRNATSKESWSYGSKFHYTEVKKINGRVRGFLYHLTMSVLPVFLALPPVRWLLRRFVFQPGHGPSEEDTQHDTIEMRAVAIPAHAEGSPRYVLGRARWDRGIYDMSGLYLVLAAKVILQLWKEKAGEAEVGKGDCYARREGGGVLTPACLGEAFLEGAKSAGMTIEIGEGDISAP